MKPKQTEPQAQPPRAPECPHLGLKHDPDTALAFSAAENHCFHCKIPAAPTLEHQDLYCLTEKHPDCPIFAAEVETLPAEMRLKLPDPPRRWQNWQAALAIGLLGILLLGALGLWNSRRNTPMPGPSATPSPSPTASLSATVSPSPSPLPSATPKPTDTPIPQAGYALDTPYAINGQQFLLHRVIEGEQLVILARNYETSVAAIFAVNYQMTLAAAGSVIVILPKSDSAAGLPAFWTYQVTGSDTSLPEIAARLGADLAQTQTYNGCSGGCLLQKDGWLLMAFPATPQP